MSRQRKLTATLPERFAIAPLSLIASQRINATALRLWLHLYWCAFVGESPDWLTMQHVCGRVPYAGNHWQPASERHVYNCLEQLESAGFLRWSRRKNGGQFDILYGSELHAHANQESPQLHEHAVELHEHAVQGGPLYSIKNQEDDDEEGDVLHVHAHAENALALEQLTAAGIGPTVARELADGSPQWAIDEICARIAESGRPNIGAVVTWARARQRAGWKEQTHGTNRTLVGASEYGSEADLPRWLHNSQ